MIEETIWRICRGIGSKREEAKIGEQGRRVEIACYLPREMGVAMADIARILGVGTSAIVMAIRRRDSIGSSTRKL